MTTPHAKTAEEVAKMVTFVPSSISGIASIVIGPHNEAIQGYELRPITAGDAFAEKAAKEIQGWFATALREAVEAEHERCKGVHRLGYPSPPSGHILDDAGNVRRVLGKLSVTADGCVVGVDAEVWRAAEQAIGGEVRPEILRFSWGHTPTWTMPWSWYSTREAALHAKDAHAGE